MLFVLLPQDDDGGDEKRDVDESGQDVDAAVYVDFDEDADDEEEEDNESDADNNDDSDDKVEHLQGPPGPPCRLQRGGTFVNSWCRVRVMSRCRAWAMV